MPVQGEIPECQVARTKGADRSVWFDLLYTRQPAVTPPQPDCHLPETGDPHIIVTESAINVLMISDRRLFADALTGGLAGEPDIQLLEPRHSIRSLVRVAPPPDVVVVAGRARDGSAADVLRASTTRWPRMTAVAIVDSDRLEPILDLVQAGADGVLPASAGLDELVSIIRRASNGEPLLSPSLLQSIAERLRDRPQVQHRLAPLTMRELEVLRALAQGLPAAEIAEHLGTRKGTVRTHIQNILRKLGAHSSLEAVAIALRHGIVEAPSDD